ncbi:MAG: fused response regulator/phosphatase [Sediminimonas qiaohouensis]|uniref:Fused response regulator/phosphatase n=2 Tax=Sediminimonas qiaohouensis TaxID=552061 RepID=A0A7C9LNU9_9RHOB|nr:fused response regulator/phosphatase [Sediminimonas qiaohouensis]
MCGVPALIARKTEPSSQDLAGPDVRDVLIVDDSKMQRRILATSISRWGFRVTEAASAREALEQCKIAPPDIVLSDWMMPVMDGLEFCKAFREMPRDQYGYFILLTSKSDKNAVALGLDCGADDFLNKPVNTAELRARINAGARLLRTQRELKEKNRLIGSTLQQLQGLYDAVDRDLIEARKLQQSLLRDRYKDFGPAQVSLVLQSSGHVGGDLVGFYPVNDSHFGLFALDVSGHGISSALMTARLAGYLSSAAPEHNVALRRAADGSYEALPPAEVVETLNRLFLDEMATEHYFTLLLADVNLHSGEVIFAQAGHPHPILQRKDGSVTALGDGGLPVGLLPDATFEQTRITLNAGDRLLIQSDGITECMTPSGEMLNDEGVMHLMEQMQNTCGEEFLNTLLTHLHAYTGDRDFADDVSAVLLEF